MTFLRWVRSLIRNRRLERDMHEEMGRHLELATERLMARGLSADEAHRAALREFGNVHFLQEKARDVRGARWLGAISPDAKLALRMLVKNPLLTVVGGLGMAVAICIAIGFFTWMSWYYSSPPLEEGERVVTVEYIEGDFAETTLVDYLVWTGRAVRSLEDLSAYRRRFDVVVEGGRGGSLSAEVIEMTASGFRLARVPPHLGRPLLDSDEIEGAAPVVVIGFDEWQQLFGGTADTVGRELLLDGRSHTVVGVMPDGFRFPRNDGLWTALDTDVSIASPYDPPPFFVFARLAPGVDAGAAEAELTAIGERLATEDSRNRERFRLVVVPFIRHILDVQQYPPWLIWLTQLVAALILSIVAVNVAVLVYARTALRTGEITVRTALGATRGRIVSQLFLEALALSLAAAALGLIMAEIGFRQMFSLVEDFQDFLPYWLSVRLPTGTVFYAIGLAALAAFIVGVLPALQATGRHLQSTLRHLGGGTGIRMGKTWTALICIQVAVAVGVLPAVLGVAWNYAPPPALNFPAAETLSFRPQPSAEGSSGPRSDYAALQAELLRRVEALPGVVGVSFASGSLARGMLVDVAFEVPNEPAEPVRGATVHRVDPSYFDVLGVPLLTGRRLQPGDAHEDATAVIVNRGFVDQFFTGGNALGRRFRESAFSEGRIEPDGPWFEIVGVVENMFVPRGGRFVFHATTIGSAPLSMVARTRGIEPSSLVAPVRELVDEVGLGRGMNAAPLDTYFRADRGELRFLLVLVGVITLSVLLLSAAGISAMMSFAVTRRQREIGVRTALGATRRQVIASIFKRSGRQLAIGALLGAVVAALLDRVTGGAMLDGQAAPLLALVGCIMLLAGTLATLAPARRALRLQPMDALREE